MITDPKKVKFETMRDVVDYVSKGFLPPIQKNFNTVIEKVSLSPEDRIEDESEIIVPNIETECISCWVSTLNQIQKNRVRNRNIAIGAVTGTIGLILLGMIIKGSNKTEKKIDLDKTYVFEDDNGRIVHVVEIN